MTTEERRAIHCYVEPDTYEAWHDFCIDEGISVTALIQVLGDELAVVLGPRSPMGPTVIRQARRVAAARRRRRGGVEL